MGKYHEAGLALWCVRELLATEFSFVAMSEGLDSGYDGSPPEPLKVEYAGSSGFFDLLPSFTATDREVRSGPMQR